ncbi:MULTISPECIES: acyl dehydratase [unclassified Mesorhizobium]|uniref:acyl dehydratase n=1 Tax=unclassified Mesorhizobium TaxID=325217 RepID=UPI00112B1F61|nr:MULTISPECIES: acyl dehydratase [unclassified Mesorhizobium]MBZ9894356.1 acyl dehydratase [Mesorhizobium sp. BR1-1-6]TPM57685.1 acyl dehydratase [Mesorhizobium sp. B2-2-4]TPM65512.1 acyl dehydratase [Mesorhizobium sp. B2-2-1]TPM98487.1 acyl dehydratase [Mesorhizobium sp. B2-1-5]TPN38578.1 acyl dehydratase [Mesorhizobium sp. B1-1-6]
MTQVYFDDVEVGSTIPQIAKGPMTTAHIMRWSAAMENWHRIHYDKPYATEHDKVPDVLINGSWKQHVLSQMLKDWAGAGGWPWKIAFQYREMDLPGDTITGWGKVTGMSEKDGLGHIELEIGLRNSRGLDSTKGTATVVLPKRGGKPVPYPFVAPKA